MLQSGDDDPGNRGGDGSGGGDSSDGSDSSSSGICLPEMADCQVGCSVCYFLVVRDLREVKSMDDKGCTSPRGVIGLIVYVAIEYGK